MAVVSKLRYLRISPRKVRLVADLIRKNKVEHAERILNFTVKKAAGPIAKLLKTAVADARNNFHLNPDNLYISRITVDEGPKYKRWRPRSRGMVNQIKKRTSHITLVLEETKPGKEAKAIGGKERVSRIKKARKEISPVKKLKDKKEKKVIKSNKEFLVEGLAEGGTKIRQPKSRPEIEPKGPKPKNIGGLKRIFRRKAF